MSDHPHFYLLQLHYRMLDCLNLAVGMGESNHMQLPDVKKTVFNEHRFLPPN